MAAKKRQTKPRTASGGARSTSAHAVVSKLTPPSLLYAPASKKSSCNPSLASIAWLNGLAMVNLQEAVARLWLAALCALPQAVWLQRSRTITSPVPCTTRVAPTCVRCSVRSSEPMTTKTQPGTGKKPLPLGYFEPSLTHQAPKPVPLEIVHQTLAPTLSLLPSSLPVASANTEKQTARRNKSNRPGWRNFPFKNQEDPTTQHP
jgi:hypothetical protein